MIIKTFTADSMAAALKLVRSELGKDSVVLKSREIPGGTGSSRVEITACTERPLPAVTTPVAPISQAKPTVAQLRASVKPFAPQAVTNRLQASAPVPSPNPAQDPLALRLEQIEATLNRLVASPEFRGTGNNLAAIHATLRNADIPQGIIEDILSSIKNTSESSEIIAQVRAQLVERLSAVIAPAISFEPGDRVLFYGPAGSGKTSALGKLAARLVFQEKQKVTLVSLDTLKVGASEEIQSYGDIIGSSVEPHDSAASSLDANTIALIDTAALPRTTEQIDRLRGQIDTLKPNYRFAVLSALMRSDDINAIAGTIAALAPTHFIMSGLDLTDRWGGVFAGFAATSKPLAFTANTPGGIGALMTPDAAAFVKTLLGSEDSRG